MNETGASTSIEASSEPAESDETLMSAYARGSEQAFAALYARHKGALYRYFLRQISETEANDCFQELWLRVIRSRSRYAPRGTLTGYLFTLAHNVLMDHYRKSRRIPQGNPTDLEALVDDTADLETGLDRKRLRDKLALLLARLPQHQREVWILKQETDLSTRDIAEVTQASEEGVKSRLRYATKKLKAGMAGYGRRD